MQVRHVLTHRSGSLTYVLRTAEEMIEVWPVTRKDAVLHSSRLALIVWRLVDGGEGFYYTTIVIPAAPWCPHDHDDELGIFGTQHGMLQHRTCCAPRRICVTVFQIDLHAATQADLKCLLFSIAHPHIPPCLSYFAAGDYGVRLLLRSRPSTIAVPICCIHRPRRL